MRLFIAIDIPQLHKTSISDFVKSVDQGDPRIKWVKEQNLHLTLKFLGDVSEAGVKNVCRAVEKCTEDISQFDLTLSGIGYFPTPRNPRVVWVGLNEEGQLLIKQLGSKLDVHLEDLGFDREQHRKAHLTIARVKEGAEYKQMMSNINENKDVLPQMSFSVVHITVYDSILGPKGPTYKDIFKSILK